VKRVARLADAKERGVRNWFEFEAKNGPSGEHLIALMRRSDVVGPAAILQGAPVWRIGFG
jgi:hypothetical protein